MSGGSDTRSWRRAPLTGACDDLAIAGVHAEEQVLVCSGTPKSSDVDRADTTGTRSMTRPRSFLVSYCRAPAGTTATNDPMASCAARRPTNALSVGETKPPIASAAVREIEARLADDQIAEQIRLFERIVVVAREARSAASAGGPSDSRSRRDRGRAAAHGVLRAMSTSGVSGELPSNVTMPPGSTVNCALHGRVNCSVYVPPVVLSDPLSVSPGTNSPLGRDRPRRRVRLHELQLAASAGRRLRSTAGAHPRRA